MLVGVGSIVGVGSVNVALGAIVLVALGASVSVGSLVGAFVRVGVWVWVGSSVGVLVLVGVGMLSSPSSRKQNANKIIMSTKVIKTHNLALILQPPFDLDTIKGFARGCKSVL